VSEGLLVIERLAAALEKCASVDEIKDVRDRAMAVQLYARKKAGGLAAAQSAGRVVTQATMMLARLYAEETEAKPGPKPRDGELLMGKKAIAEAAGMAAPNLSSLRPLIDAPRAEIAATMERIEARGEVVTPAALLREVTAASSAEGYDGDEWQTPAGVLVLVVKVLGAIEAPRWRAGPRNAPRRPRRPRTRLARRHVPRVSQGLLAAPGPLRPAPAPVRAVPAAEADGGPAADGAFPMKLVVIESPYAGDVERNLRYLRACLRDSLLRGEAPFASHGLYTQAGVLDDAVEAERARGMSAGWAWMRASSLVAVYTDLGISGGMAAGIAAADRAGVRVEYRSLAGWLP
jgi:hypothetical protein